MAIFFLCLGFVFCILAIATIWVFDGWKGWAVWAILVLLEFFAFDAYNYFARESYKVECIAAGYNDVVERNGDDLVCAKTFIIKKQK